MNGAYELRDPGPQFSSLRYHKAYPDVTAGGSPALMHFLRNGMAEGRTAFRVIEDDWSSIAPEGLWSVLHCFQALRSGLDASPFPSSLKGFTDGVGGL